MMMQPGVSSSTTADTAALAEESLSTPGDLNASLEKIYSERSALLSQLKEAGATIRTLPDLGCPIISQTLKIDAIITEVTLRPIPPEWNASPELALAYLQVRSHSDKPVKITYWYSTDDAAPQFEQLFGRGIKFTAEQRVVLNTHIPATDSQDIEAMRRENNQLFELLNGREGRIAHEFLQASLLDDGAEVLTRPGIRPPARESQEVQDALWGRFIGYKGE